MKLGTCRYARVLILNSTIVFLNFDPKIPYFGKFSPQTSECLVLNEPRFIEVFKGADS